MCHDDIPIVSEILLLHVKRLNIQAKVVFRNSLSIHCTAVFIYNLAKSKAHFCNDRGHRLLWASDVSEKVVACFYGRIFSSRDTTF